MTNKDLVKEIIWLLIAGGLSFILTNLLLQPRYDAMVTSIFNVDSLISDIAFKLRLLLTFLFLFPILFLLTSVREISNKLKRRPQNIYLLFICLISVFSSLVFLAYLKPFATILFGSWTIYPPLTPIPGEFIPPTNFDVYYYSVLSFLTVQLVMTAVTCRQVFKKLDVTH